MQFGFKLRGLLIKTLVFLSMAVVAVVSVRFVEPVFAPLIVFVLAVLVFVLNRVINRRLGNMWGRELLSIGSSYVIYEKGIYVKPMDIFYPWYELKTVTNSINSVTLIFNDGTEIALPNDVGVKLRGFVPGIE
ncbi:MAG: hypothetical protein RQ877_07360 [Vulcanisaeta sp.]|jgi:hypothetical protein|nr:hypothetical protein [Vulcanisaeta sp.]